MIQWDTPFTTFMTIHSIVVNVVLVRTLLLRNRGNTVHITKNNHPTSKVKAREIWGRILTQDAKSFNLSHQPLLYVAGNFLLTIAVPWD